MSFLYGAFIGVSIWELIQFILTIPLLGRQTTLDGTTLAAHLILMFAFFAAAFAVKAGVVG